MQLWATKKLSKYKGLSENFGGSGVSSSLSMKRGARFGRYPPDCPPVSLNTVHRGVHSIDVAILPLAPAIVGITDFSPGATFDHKFD